MGSISSGLHSKYTAFLFGTIILNMLTMCECESGAEARSLVPLTSLSVAGVKCGLSNSSCCWSSCDRLWGLSGEPARAWQKMAFTGDDLNLRGDEICDNLEDHNQQGELVG